MARLNHDDGECGYSDFDGWPLWPGKGYTYHESAQDSAAEAWSTTVNDCLRSLVAEEVYRRTKGASESADDRSLVKELEAAFENEAKALAKADGWREVSYTEEEEVMQ